MIFRWKNIFVACKSVHFREDLIAILRNEMAQAEAIIEHNSAQRNSDWNPYLSVCSKCRTSSRSSELYQFRYNPSSIKVKQHTIHMATIPWTINATTTGSDVISYQCQYGYWNKEKSPIFIPLKKYIKKIWIKIKWQFYPCFRFIKSIWIFS